MNLLVKEAKEMARKRKKKMKMNNKIQNDNKFVDLNKSHILVLYNNDNNNNNNR